MSTWLVIPSCRPASLQLFFDAWGGRGGWDRVVIVEDQPQKSGLWGSWGGQPPTHFSHKEIAEVLGEDAWIISKKDSACRCFGFLWAWWNGADRVITLDDDCYPLPGCENFAEMHGDAMIHPQWVPSVPGMDTRGMPYYQRGMVLNVMANVGLWTENPDLDAPQTLVHGNMAGYVPPPGNRIVPAGQFAPLCGMNLCIQRQALPLFFFPLMGDGQPYRRMDDIWSGIIAKHCMDHLGWRLSVGEPFVKHCRASDPMANLVKEAPGIAANETFWQTIAEIDLTAADAIGCMEEIGQGLLEESGYLRNLGNALKVWAKLCRKGLPANQERACTTATA